MKTFTSESVTEGHPDKVCDAISDRILDAFLAQDPHSRTAIETVAFGNTVVVGGEVSSHGEVDIEHIVRDTIGDIGYTKEDGLDPSGVEVQIRLGKQSPDIAQGVNQGYETLLDAEQGGTKESNVLGAGDQGLMFGYANTHTKAYLPRPLYLAHQLSAMLTAVRKNETLPFLRPDGKTQVTVRFDDNNNPIAIDNVVVSTQHSEDVSLDEVRNGVLKKVVYPILEHSDLKIADTHILVNPTGRFVIGGPVGDAGLTGRKIIVDTYGGWARHGGGCFSGKDGTKVDRSAAYALRWVAKNIVAAGLAKEVEIQASYAIGIAEPTSLYVNTFGTGEYNDQIIENAVREVFDLSPQEIIASLDLQKPIYSQTTNYGHFGRERFAWEKTNKVDELQRWLA